MRKFKDLTGQKFCRLTVIERAETVNKCTMWLCKCNCGKTIIASAKNLLKGNTKSCGCLQKEIVAKKMSERNSTHKKSNTRLYNIWRGMKQRCYSTKHISYKNYGARGIVVCNEWINDFKAFYDWAYANGYEDNLTIDRIDVNGNYEPLNCRFASTKEQSRNKVNNRFITYNNETFCLKDWAIKIGIREDILRFRLNHNWSVEKALTTPVRQIKRKAYNGI